MNHKHVEAVSDEEDERVQKMTEENERKAHMEAAMASGQMPAADVEKQMRTMSRRSFLWGAVAVAGGVGGVRWIASRRPEEGIAWPLLRVLQTNGQLARD